MPVHPSELFFKIALVQGGPTAPLRLTRVQGLVLLLSVCLVVVFCWVCFGCVLVACVVLWFVLLGRFTEPAFHPQLLAIR